jgi:hypothetical protein
VSAAAPVVIGVAAVFALSIAPAVALADMNLTKRTAATQQ